LGQDDLTVKDARRIVGPNAIIGVSTHSIEQVRQAVLDGANYIGVGPTFPTTTKSFDAFPGLDLIRRQSAEVRLPAFAIGGIVLANVDQVLAAGARRIAVSSAICSSRDPRQAAAEFRSRLDKLPRN
jgi:thiamine-phosphate pyrophosphorylase